MCVTAHSKYRTRNCQTLRHPTSGRRRASVMQNCNAPSRDAKLPHCSNSLHLYGTSSTLRWTSPPQVLSLYPLHCQCSQWRRRLNYMRMISLRLHMHSCSNPLFSLTSELLVWLRIMIQMSSLGFSLASISVYFPSIFLPTSINFATTAGESCKSS